jgi:hypothetical protein
LEVPKSEILAQVSFGFRDLTSTLGDLRSKWAKGGWRSEEVRKEERGERRWEKGGRRIREGKGGKRDLL